MPKPRCDRCRYYDTAILVYGWGRCSLTESIGGDYDDSTKAYAEDWDDYYAVLLVRPDFGCVQFEELEDQVRRVADLRAVEESLDRVFGKPSEEG